MPSSRKLGIPTEPLSTKASCSSVVSVSTLLKNKGKGCLRFVKVVGEEVVGNDVTVKRLHKEAHAHPVVTVADKTRGPPIVHSRRNGSGRRVRGTRKNPRWVVPATTSLSRHCATCVQSLVCHSACAAHCVCDTLECMNARVRECMNA